MSRQEFYEEIGRSKAIKAEKKVMTIRQEIDMILPAFSPASDEKIDQLCHMLADRLEKILKTEPETISHMYSAAENRVMQYRVYFTDLINELRGKNK